MGFMGSSMKYKKRHRVKHHSDHRDNREKLQRTLKNGSINFFVPLVLIFIISLANKVLVENFSLWVVRGLALVVILWCIVGFFMLMNGLLLWLRVKAG